MTLLARETEALDEFTKGCAKVRQLLNESPCHPGDEAEMVMHIHGIQNLVMARSATRADLARFNHVRAFCDWMIRGGKEGLELCRDDHASPRPGVGEAW